MSQHRQPLRVGCQREGEFEWMPEMGVATSGKLGSWSFSGLMLLFDTWLLERPLRGNLCSWMGAC